MCGALRSRRHAGWRVHDGVEEKTSARACGTGFRVPVHHARADFPRAQAAETDAPGSGTGFRVLVHHAQPAETDAPGSGTGFRVLVHHARADFPRAQPAETDAPGSGTGFLALGHHARADFPRARAAETDAPGSGTGFRARCDARGMGLQSQKSIQNPAAGGIESRAGCGSGTECRGCPRSAASARSGGGCPPRP